MRRKLVLVATLVIAPFASVAFADAPAVSNGPASGSIAVASSGPVRFWGFGLDWSFWDDNTLNTASYRNDIANLFLPRWDIGEVAFRGTPFHSLSLGGRFVVTRALTGYDDTGYSGQNSGGPITPCSNLTPSANGTVDVTKVQRCNYGNNPDRTDYSDVLLSLSNPSIATIPKLGININPSITLTLPASAQSQLATLQAGLGFGLGLNRSFLGGKVNLAYVVGFTKYFHRYTTANYSNGSTSNANGSLSTNNPNVDLSQVASNDANFLADPGRDTSVGGYNSSYALRQIFLLSINPTERLGISALYIMSDAWAYPIDSSCLTTLNGQVQDLCAAGQQVAQGSGASIVTNGSAHKRGQQIFWLTVGYQLLDWLNVNVAWYTGSLRTFDDGSPRQPFISTNYDAFTSVSLGATITLEKLAAKAF